MTFRFAAALAFAAVAAFASAGPAQAQSPAPAAAATDYPTRTIKFVVPFAAGSATDTLARVLGQEIGQVGGPGQGWSVMVENIAGASGILAAQSVARAPADGYTVLITTNTTHAANQNLFKKLPYDPVGDFAPVTKLGTVPLALAVHPSVPAGSVAALVAYGKANPGKLSFGSGSTSARMAGEMMKSLGGFDMLHVPYKSNPLAMTDLLGGQISLMFADITTTLPQIQAGKVKGLAVSSAQRSRFAPDLPTMAEAGMAGYDLVAWFGAFVPAKTPPAVVATLNRALATALANKGVQEALFKAGIEPESGTPEALAGLVASETAKWAGLVKAAGIQPE